MLTNRIIAAISLLFIAFIPVLGYAGVHDGNDLLHKCNNVIKIYEDGIEESEITTTMLSDASFCNGMMQGITNTIIFFDTFQVTQSIVCLPENGISNGRAAKVVIKYLKEHPEQLHVADSGLAFLAMMDAFPCK
jgi:hypothetical protein